MASSGTKKTIFTAAAALLACGMLYGVMLREEEQAVLAAEPTATPIAEPVFFGPREPEYLVYLAEQGLYLRAENPAMGEYHLGAGEAAPVYPFTVLLHEDGSVSGFLLELPPIREPEESNLESAVDLELRRRANRLLAEEEEALLALLPPLLSGAAPEGGLSAGVRSRWLQAARKARSDREAYGEPMEPDIQGDYCFQVDISGDGSLTVILDRAAAPEDSA